MFPTEKKNKKALFNRIFSIAGLSIGGAILAGLIVYVARTMDVRALLASIQPLWLLGAALCVPLSESVDALIFYGMGRSAGCPVKLAGCFDAAYIGEFYYKLGPAGAPVQLKLMYDAGMSATYTASIYTWKAVANTMVYTGYAVAALAYELFWRREGLGPAVAGAGAHRTHQDGSAVPVGFEDRGAHQRPFRPHIHSHHSWFSTVGQADVEKIRPSPCRRVTPEASQCSSRSRAHRREQPRASLAWAREKGAGPKRPRSRASAARTAPAWSRWPVESSSRTPRSFRRRQARRASLIRPAKRGSTRAQGGGSRPYPR